MEGGKCQRLTSREIDTSQVGWWVTGEIIDREMRCTRIGYEAFIFYLIVLERENPGKRWQQLIAYLHATYYQDVEGTVPVFGNRLFIHGAETGGYKNVTHVTANKEKVPCQIVDIDGIVIHAAHSYAAIRSDLNRKPGFYRDLMIHLNTHAGDTYQVVKSPFVEGGGYGRINWGKASIDQRRGSEMGLWLSKYYRSKLNKDTPLSQAYTDYFSSVEYTKKRNDKYADVKDTLRLY